jgi:hypothetical protein
MHHFFANTYYCSHDPIKAIDTTNHLFGAAFWATLISGAVFWVITAAIAFTMVSEGYRTWFDGIYANLIGASVTIITKILIMQCFRINWYGGFMRRRPAGINIINAFEDSWNLGLTTLIIIIRSVRLIGCALFYIGRLDTPFLAPGVGWLFDKFPMGKCRCAFVICN